VADRLGTVDLVYVKIGAWCWLPDIADWSKVCAGFLKDGGQLYGRDVHPITFSVDDDAPVGELPLRYPYFETEQGIWRLPDIEGKPDRRLPLMFSLRATNGATRQLPSAPPSR